MLWPRDVVRGAPSWERIAYRGFGGAYSTFELRIRLKREVDWSRLVARVGERYREESGAWVAPGRRIAFEPRGVTLGVSGTLSELPGDDGGLQNALILAVLEQAGDLVTNVGTERWTDTHFEEPPEKIRSGQSGVDLLVQLVQRTLIIRVEELDYYPERYRGGPVANPELHIHIEGPTSTVLGARQNWMPAERFVVPGSYLLYAVVPAFAVVGYPPKLGKYSRYPIFDSASLTVSGRPGEVIRLRVGLPSSKRALDPAHLAFLEQWNKEEIVPPPPPMRAVELEQLVEEDAREA